MMLKRGDAVGVVATGFAPHRGQLSAGIRALERMGYRPVTTADLGVPDGYFAADDGARSADLNQMLGRDDVRAIWFARGGYGTVRILERVDWKSLSRKRPILVGYSDLTALFSAAIARGAGPCLYGPVVSELGRPEAYHLPSLRRALRGGPVEIPFRRTRVLREGRAEGILVGGNLTVVVHLLGTPYEPDLRGRILFLEDINEETYRIDRLLTHLRMSGVLKGVRGIVIGGLKPAPSRRRFPPDRAFDDLLEETFVSLGVPVIRDLPCGHMPRKRTLPLGCPAGLDTGTGRLRVEASRR